MTSEIILAKSLSVLFYTIFISVIAMYLNMSSILAYLFTGALLGDFGLQVIKYNEVDKIGEYGVIFLLFTIGLEISLEKLKAMWKYVFGLGILQMKFCSILLSIVVYFITYNLKLSVIIGISLSLSSTAIVMQILKDTHNNNNHIGRASISILLLQDLMVIFLLVLIPTLSDNSLSSQDLLYITGKTLIKTLTVLISIFLIGRLILQPLFYITSANKSKLNHELFIATTITTALSTGYLTYLFGLSMELGAFIAGMIIAETEFQHAAETNITPFKGLLLGLFFISVGTKIDIFFIYHNLPMIILLSVTIILIKFICITGLTLFFNIKTTYSYFTAILLSQSSEFGFIILDKLFDLKLLDFNLNNILLSSIILTMASTPILINLVKKFLLQSHQNIHEISLENQDLKNHIVIAGYNEAAEMLTHVLQFKNISYVGIEINRNKKINDRCIFNGDATKINFLKAMNISTANFLIINIANKTTVENLVLLMKKYYPHITIIATHNDLPFLNQLGVHHIVQPNYEAGVRTAKLLFSCIGMSEIEKNNTMRSIRDHNYLLPREIILEQQQNAKKSNSNTSNKTNKSKSKKNL